MFINTNMSVVNGQVKVNRNNFLMNKNNSNPQVINLKTTNNQTFGGLGSWFSKKVSQAGNLFTKAIDAVKNVGAAVKTIVTNKLQSLASNYVDSNNIYVVKDLTEESNRKRVDVAKKTVDKLDKKLEEILRKNVPQGGDPEKIIDIYTKNLNDVIIGSSGSGKEKGLNKVIGMAELKTDLYSDFLMPLYQTLQGRSKHCFIPNGINFFGPKGTGKTYFVEQLGEHYIDKGGYYKKFKFSNDSVKDIEDLDKVFAEAETNFIKSGKTKYTMLLFDEMEKYLERSVPSQKPTIARLLELTNNCRDRGVIFMSTSNYLDRVEPALLRTGRTDLRIPVGHIAEYDLADIINYYLKMHNLPYTEEKIDFQEIVDAVKTEKLQYKPKDVERRLVKEADNVYDYGGQLTTESIKDALVKSSPEFDEQEYSQFVNDKKYAKQLGGIYEYDK